MSVMRLIFVPLLSHLILLPSWVAAQSAPPPASLESARALLEQKAPAKAEERVRAYLRQKPHSAEAHFLLGYILFREIQFNATALSPASANASRDSHARASLAEYTEGARYNTPAALDLKIVALDYVLLSDYPDAEKWITASLARNSSDVQGWYYLGRIQFKLANYSAALQSFTHSLQLQPQDVKTEDNLVLTY
jgi:cytochrome c-type biogenesis protein CcmH/NrfG